MYFYIGFYIERVRLEHFQAEIFKDAREQMNTLSLSLTHTHTHTHTQTHQSKYLKVRNEKQCTKS
jgi:hypothetical protein